MDRKFLEDVKEFIEDAVSAHEWEWGSGRSLKELIDNGKMPELYYEVIQKLIEVDLNSKV